MSRNQKTWALAVLAAVAVLAVAAGAGAITPGVSKSATEGTVVENYRAESTILFLSSAKGGRSTGTIVVDNLEFEAGDISYSGGKIDFAGREGDFQSLEANFAAEPDADANSVLQGSGEALGKDGDTASTAFVGLGGAFSVEDLKAGDTFKGSGALRDFDSSLVPELAGSDLFYQSTYTILSVDAVNAVARAACAGAVIAVPQTLKQGPTQTARLPGDGAAAGLALMAIGLVGAGATWRRSG